MKGKFDFSGWATRNDLKCSDGRTIRANAFSQNDGKTVPLCWMHDHDDPAKVLGHAVLENRKKAYTLTANLTILQLLKLLNMRYSTVM